MQRGVSRHTYGHSSVAGIRCGGGKSKCISNVQDKNDVSDPNVTDANVHVPSIFGGASSESLVVCSRYFNDFLFSINIHISINTLFNFCLMLLFVMFAPLRVHLRFFCFSFGLSL